ncbi:MAG: glycosyltransferase family 2 protein [Patescibacteria group bacterium]
MFKKKISPQVTIIIVTYNHHDITVACIRSLIQCTLSINYEIIIIDNGSTHPQKKLLREKIARFRSSRIQYISNIVNIGYSRANNQGAKLALGKYLVFINNDTVVTQGWLSGLLSFMKSHPGVGACGPKLHSFGHKDYFDYSGAGGGYLDILGYPFTRGRVFDRIEKDVGQYDSPAEITWATGSCLMVKRDLFAGLKGFDEFMFAYNEEIDLCIRIRKKGYSIYSIPKSLVYHHGAYTSNNDLVQKIFLNHRNNLYLFLKNYSLWPYFLLLLVRFLLDFGAILYYLIELKPGFALAVIRAYFDLLICMPYLIRNKIITLKGRSLLGLQTLYKGSIVFDYFVLNHKNFNQIMRYPLLSVSPYKRYAEITHNTLQ